MQRESRLSERRISAAREIFSLFDRNGSGLVSLSSLPTMIRGLGACPTEADLEKIAAPLQNPSNTIDFAAFLAVLARHFDQVTNDEEILYKALRFQDKERTGFLLIDDFVHNMGSAGEKLSPEQLTQLNAFISEVAESENKVDVELFTKFLVRSNQFP